MHLNHFYSGALTDSRMKIFCLRSDKQEFIYLYLEFKRRVTKNSPHKQAYIRKKWKKTIRPNAFPYCRTQKQSIGKYILKSVL
ncbi:hypothetical protein D5274_03245 [bacterium 1XD42-94]|nr:hypothetical protein [bacterium 1XD42-76]NBK04198.1 hypothetical protein [bacterium 1XD42-94]